MNVEKKKHLEKTYERILNVGFCIIPYEDLSDIISSDPMIYGTAKDERILSFEGVEALFKFQYEQIGNMKPSFNRSRIALQVSNGENNACIVEEITLKFSSDEENHSIFMRATCMMEYLDNKWKLTHWHTSTPVDTENDPWHMEEWKREKEKLQQLVDQQTATLRQNNRELQIEAALERVRSRSMAMTKSEQLSGVILEIHNKFKELDISMESRIAIVVVFDSDGKDFNQYIASNDVGNIYISTPYFEHPILDDFYTAKESGVEFFSKSYSEDEKNSYFKTFFETSIHDEIEGVEEQAKWVFDQKYYTHSQAFQKSSSIGMADYSGIPLNDSEIDIIKRFSKVFDQAYTRFLDLKKAELQAREAQINLAVERVRAKALAMHKSDEIMEVVAKLKEEVMGLDIPNVVASTIFLEADNDNIRMWDLSSLERSEKGYLAITDITFQLKKKDPNLYIKRVWENPNDYFVEVQNSKDLDRIIEFMYENNQLEIAKEVEDYTRSTNLEKLYHASRRLNNGKLCIDLLEPPPDEMEIILNKIGAAFDLAYKRFEDLQKAEAQTREAQIEVALERLRAQSMAMHNSEDVGKCIVKMFDELTALGVPQNTRFGIGILNHDNEDNQLWTASRKDNQVKLHVGHISMAWHPLLKSARKAWLEKVPLHAYILEGEDLRKYYKVLNEAPDYPLQINIAELPERQFHYGFVFDHGFFYAFNDQALEDHLIQITQRFSSLFAQTYRRYLDLKKAEEQAREAKIQLALERIRAKTMAMKTQSDLLGIVELFGQQLSDLDVRFTDVTFIEGAITKNRDWELWSHVPNADNFTHKIHIPYIDTPYFTKTAKAVEEYERTGNSIQTKFFSKEEKDEFLDHYWKYAPAVPEKIMDLVYSNPGSTIVDAFLEEVTVSIVRNDLEPFKDEELSIFERFAKEFKQTYIRFLDIKKAEEQAREANIETAIEKVRASSMSIQKSDELIKVVRILNTEIKGLGIDVHGTQIITDFAVPEKGLNCWFAKEGLDYLEKFHIPYFKHPITENYLEAAKNVIDYYKETFSKKEKDQYLEFLFKSSDFSTIPKERQDLLLSLPLWLRAVVISKNSALVFQRFNLDEFTKEHEEIFKRFGKVFEQAYTRFLDLQKVEEQAREAQIEAALERVRSRSMAMHKSNELRAIVNTIYNELRNLKVNFHVACIQLLLDESKDIHLWIGSEDGVYKDLVSWPYVDIRIMNEVHKARLNKSPIEILLTKTETKEFFEEYFKLDGIPKERKAATASVSLIDIVGNFQANTSVFIMRYSEGSYTEDEKMITERFSKVFEQTYTRFLDLQKAEAREREAVKQASLDRVRGEIASMRTAKDLERITPLVWKELTALGVPFFRCGVFIIREDEEMVRAYLSTPDGKSVAALHLPFKDEGTQLIKPAVDNWRKQKPYKEEWDQEKFIQQMHSFMEKGQIENPKSYQVMDAPPERLVLHLVPFRQGMLYVGHSDDLNQEQLGLIESLAFTFSVAYSRYEDFKALEDTKNSLELTLTDLKATQTQLIQSEKMASLGELTAGIAHEIQNPLNFVNNFSEVSKELLEEMQEELENGDFEEVKAIMQDVIQNLEKINHHGKRADGIVKGMLQHSRAGNDKKEPTDINALADEYMRLAYHGLRAKDKSFNAELVTDFDESIGKIDIIPQDIGRVILNLLTNAFYAVNEKKKSPLTPASPSGRPKGGNTYKPIVKITTKKQEDKVIIKVTDNGKGIPDHVRDKIFQPFFTTKPTGQGTGLGLSMSYDIITKGHNGAFEVESIEGQSTTFRIILPLNKSNS